MTRKIGLLILVIVVSIILATVYGILHNQVSYSISEEYFTKFKFEQFGFVEYGLDTPRITAGIVGLWSTWWLGLLIGLVNGIVGFTQKTAKTMWKSAFGATIRTLGIAIGFGVLGILIGKFLISNLSIDWNVPTDLTEQKNFLTAGTMHNFSYVGGVIGLVYGIVYQLNVKKACA
jgi:hypothetical protein